MKKIAGHLILLFLILFISCTNSDNPDQAGRISLHAAAGTRPATEAVCDAFEQETDYIVERNYASAGTLARQIVSGASADVFISANAQWIDFLKDRGMLQNTTIRVLARNRIVVIARKGKTVNIEFTPDFDILAAIPDKIAIGDPGYVPVGRYAKNVFDNLEWTEKILDRAIMGKDVMSVLHYVEMGECDWGIVYYSEALKSNKVKIVSEIPQSLYNPVVFYIAAVRDGSANGQTLIDFFLGETGQEIFKKHGFVIG